MRGQASFDRVAMKSIRTTFPRSDRDRPGLSLDELANRVGTSRRQLIRYEKGEATPEPARIAALAAALECEIRELSGATDGNTLRTLRLNARSTCGKVTQVPTAAVEVVCVHCGLHPPGPAALLDPEFSSVAKHVRYGHTLKMQATLSEAQTRNASRGRVAPFMLPSGD
ncbi:helix-turn-helix domain-containing protein [Amycolatopsis sp. cmx-4-54]|uniref:helix-turn-helix domain-containing protein n=1 Tax=Amycolatopsis sp. cmx-4-54 TaxID=2790936 RepID=UPI00397CA1E5